MRTSFFVVLCHVAPGCIFKVNNAVLDFDVFGIFWGEFVVYDLWLWQMI